MHVNQSWNQKISCKLTYSKMFFHKVTVSANV